MSTTTTINPNSTIGELARERPGRTRAFQELGVDFCCGGKKTVAEVCSEKGLDLATFTEKLRAAETARPASEDADYASMPLGQLVEHIISTHHAYLKTELPRISAMAEKVAKVHGSKDPRLAQVARVFAVFHAEISSHTMKEECILFPAICRIGEGETGGGCPFGSVAHPIGVMEAEHESAGGALAKMRELTDDFTPPDWACNTYRGLLHALSEVEADTHQHIHKENNILFPRAIEAESRLMGAGSAHA